jgi:hypothetical protein
VVLPVCSSHIEDVYTYNFPDDRQHFKNLGMCASISCALPVGGPFVLAYGIFFLETVQSGLALADLFQVSSNLATNSLFSPWVGPILVGCLAAVIVQSFFAYRIWVLSDRKSWRLGLTVLFVSPLYVKYSPDTSSQRVSLWKVLRRQWNSRDYWECLREHLPRPATFIPT